MEEEIIYFYNVKDGKYYQSRYTHRWLNNLQQQCKKQQEAIDKINLIIKGVAYGGSEDYYMEKFSKINELIKEVSE